MKATQRLTPKYWVVHDSYTDDVFIQTASKSISGATNKFLDLHAHSYFGVVSDQEVLDMYYSHQSLKCSLVEVKLMEESN